MSRIVVVGGGLIGMAAAMMFAQDGAEVVVLERDDEPVPGSPGTAWQDWDRRGIAQFRQPHYLHAGGRHILDAALPEVTEAMLGAGAPTFDLLARLPPFIEDRAPREGDERFTTVTARRPVLEYAFATCAQRHVDVRRGVTVSELVAGQPAAPGSCPGTGRRSSLTGRARRRSTRPSRATRWRPRPASTAGTRRGGRTCRWPCCTTPTPSVPSWKSSGCWRCRGTSWPGPGSASTSRRPRRAASPSRCPAHPAPTC